MTTLTLKTKSILATAMLTAISVSANAAPLRATHAPNIFVSGGMVKASEMNANFTAVFDAINNISLTPGPQGLTGSQGPQGPQGIQGIQGIQGNQGNPGVAGAAGLDGAMGPAGAAGSDAPNHTAELCALYAQLASTNSIGSLAVPSFCNHLIAECNDAEDEPLGLSGTDSWSQTFKSVVDGATINTLTLHVGAVPTEGYVLVEILAPDGTIIGNATPAINFSDSNLALVVPITSSTPLNLVDTYTLRLTSVDGFRNFGANTMGTYADGAWSLIDTWDLLFKLEGK